MSALKAATRQAPRWLAAPILAIAATVTAGCGAATPQATSTGSAAVDGIPAARAATPPVFAGTLVPARSGRAWPVGVFSSATGRLLRKLPRPPGGVADWVLSVRGGWVYFAATLRAGALSGVWRVPLSGGPARLVAAGATGYALSPDGRIAAWVVTVNHGRTTKIVVTNLVTGHRRTIVMVTHQRVYDPIGVTNLAWAPDDTHLAVEIQYAAFASEVIVLNARTAQTIADGRKAPCPGACAAKFPAYLRTGALTYLTEQLLDATNAITLVSWPGGNLAKQLVTIWNGPGDMPLVQGESTTPQGAAIWVLETQTRANGRFTDRYAIWRWPGGKPIHVKTLPPISVTQPPSAHGEWVTQPPSAYGLTDIAW